MDIHRYVELKEQGFVILNKAKTPDKKLVPIIAIRQWNSETGQEVDPQFIPLDLKSIIKQRDNLNTLIDDIKKILKDV